MAKRAATREDPDIQIEIPARFGRSLAVYAKSYQSTMCCHIIHKTKTLALFLRSLNKTSYCQFAVGLDTNECSIQYLCKDNEEDEEETKLDFSAEEAVRTMTMLRSSGDVMRLGIKSTWPYVRIEAGCYKSAKTKPKKNKAKEGESNNNNNKAKAGKKRAAEDDAEEGDEDQVKKVWSSHTIVRMARTTDATAEMQIRAKPADRFVVRIDQNYLLRRLTMHKRNTKDKQVVEISFETETRRITHDMEITKAEEDDDEDQEMRDLREKLGGGSGPAQASTMEHTVLVPTHLVFNFTAPGTSTVSTEILDIVDRRKEWSEGAVKAKCVQSGIGWREDDQCEDDAEKTIQNKKDSDLGIDSSDAAVAELFAFPVELEKQPVAFRYSVENLIRQLNSAVFSRYATFQWSDVDRAPGNLWMCSSLDLGEGKITGLCAAYQVDQ